MMTGNPSLPAEAWVKPIAIVRAEVEQTGTEAAAVGSAGPIPVAIVEIIAEASTVRITRLLRNLNTIALHPLYQPYWPIQMSRGGLTHRRE